VLTKLGIKREDFSVAFSLFNIPEVEHFVAREEEPRERHTNLTSDGSRRTVILHGLGRTISRFRLEHPCPKREVRYGCPSTLAAYDRVAIQQEHWTGFTRLLAALEPFILTTSIMLSLTHPEEY
jgi:hypothetical protein